MFCPTHTLVSGALDIESSWILIIAADSIDVRRFAEADKRIRIFNNGRNMVRVLDIIHHFGMFAVNVSNRPLYFLSLGNIQRTEPWTIGRKRTVG